MINKSWWKIAVWFSYNNFTKFACFDLAAKFFAANLLNSGVIIYFLLWSRPVILFSISLIFVLWSFFLTKLLTLGIFFNSSKSCSTSWVSNIRYFTFNFIYFSFKRRTSNIRYFSFNIFDLNMLPFLNLLLLHN